MKKIIILGICLIVVTIFLTSCAKKQDLPKLNSNSNVCSEGNAIEGVSGEILVCINGAFVENCNKGDSYKIKEGKLKGKYALDTLRCGEGEWEPLPTLQPNSP